MKDLIIRYGFVFGLLILCVMLLAISSFAGNTLNNDLLAWGFRRGENHAQAVLDTNSKKVIEEFDGITMGNNEKAYVYLTFDCGYEAGYTPAILDVLKKENVKAAFFITGHYLNSAGDMVKRMIEDGHIIGNHTVNHKCMPSMSDEEIKNEIMNLHNGVFQKFGYEMKFFRPPKGEFSERTASVVKDLAYTSVMWSLAYDDWDKEKQGREEYGKKKVLENLHNGAVILLHSTSKDNMNILSDVIKEARNMGYEFKSINDFEK